MVSVKGIGYNNNDYDNVWLDHQDDFEAVLSSLNKDAKKTETNSQEEDTSTKVNSLELKSKQRGKLHYSKFAKSKDLSRASKDDLESILGTHKRTKLSAESKDENVMKIDDENLSESEADMVRPSFKMDIKPSTSEDSDEKNQNGLNFSTNPLSIKDYFAKKMFKQFEPSANKTDELDQIVKNGEENKSNEINQDEKTEKKSKKSKS